MERYVFDVEVMGGNFFCITFLNIETREVKVFTIFDTINQVNELIEFICKKIYLIGYNSLFYDTPVLQFIIENRDSNNLTKELFEFSAQLIKNEFGSYKKLKNYEFENIDLSRIIEVNGNFPSLKQVGINLQWWRIQDLPFSYDKVVENWDEANKIIEYNLNDVLISYELYKKIYDQIELREKLSELYQTNLLNCSDSKIGDKLLEKFYKDKVGIENVWELKGKVKEYDQFSLSECIYPDVKFETNFLKRVKREIEEAVVRKETNYSFSKEVDFAGVKYQFASGGLHSVDFPALFVTDENYIIRDYDFNSFYPSMMIKNKIIPSHLDNNFIEILDNITKERVAAKKNNKVKAAALKITANSLYGKLGFIGSWIRDNRAVLQVTISGQLYLLMAIEQFVLNGIEVISANTDGIVCRIPRNLENKYYEIGNKFSEYLGIGVEYTDYDLYFRRDVNNYITKKHTGEVKYKGCYIPEIDIKKGYKYPIVPKAVYDFVIKNIPIEETIKNHRNILDFCASQKMGSDFQAEYQEMNVTTNLQKTNRVYISIGGGRLLKRNKKRGNEIGLFVGNNVRILNDFYKDIPFQDYDIDYKYYIEEAISLIKDSQLYEKDFISFVDEAEDFTPTENIKDKTEFYFQFRGMKGLSEKTIENLYLIKKDFSNKDFLNLLLYAEENKYLSSKWENLIKINYFSKFGPSKKLLNMFLEFRSGKNKYSSTVSEKTKNIKLGFLRELWNNLPNEDFSIKEKLDFELSILGRIESQFNVDNKIVYVLSVDEKYSPKIIVQSLGKKVVQELKIQKKIFGYNRLYEGDVIKCKTFEKKNAVKYVDGQYIDKPNEYVWWLTSYEKISDYSKLQEKI